MIRLHGDNLLSSVLRHLEQYIYKKTPKGPSSLNTQTHAIQMNFSLNDKKFREKCFGHDIRAGEIDTCCL